jgi:hypothetical protein
VLLALLRLAGASGFYRARKLPLKVLEYGEVAFEHLGWEGCDPACKIGGTEPGVQFLEILKAPVLIRAVRPGGLAGFARSWCSLGSSRFRCGRYSSRCRRDATGCWGSRILGSVTRNGC